MAIMTKKRRKQNRVRLSGRNAAETLNGLLEVLNPFLPEKHRVSPVKTPSDLYALRQKIKNFPEMTFVKPAPKQAVETAEIIPPVVLQALLTIATNAWRTRNKMVDSNTREPKEEMKRAYRHVEAIFDALNQIGVEIIDWQGRAYDSGMALKVITFEQTPGLSREEITETIRPSIMWSGKLIQIGEIIVGTPLPR